MRARHQHVQAAVAAGDRVVRWHGLDRRSRAVARMAVFRDRQGCRPAYDTTLGDGADGDIAAGEARQGDHRDGPRAQLEDGSERLQCLRGVSTLTAFGLAVEVGDWRRYSGSTIGAYIGLVPTESSERRGPVARARSPRPATPTPAGCCSRPPGTTGRPYRPTEDHARPVGPGPGRRASPRACRQPAPARAVASVSTSVRSAPSSRTSRSRVSWDLRPKAGRRPAA